MILHILTTFALAAGPAAPGGAAPATVAEARMMTERLKQDILQEEKAWAAETAREKEAEARRQQRYAGFGEDRRRLQEELAAADGQIRSVMDTLATHQAREKELASRFRDLNQVLAAHAGSLKAAVAAGLPYNLAKRVETPVLVARDIEGGSISPEEAMNRLWAFHQAERRLAQEAEVYSGDFHEEGSADPIQVKYLRVGKQFLAFTSLDGARMGVLRQEPPAPGTAVPAYAWVRESSLDHAARQAVKTAFATAERTAVPGFVPLPIWGTSFAAATAASVPAVPAQPAAAGKEPR